MKKRTAYVGVGVLLLTGLALMFDRSQRLIFEVVDLFYFAAPSLVETLPPGFEPPLELRTGTYRLRPLRSTDYRRDYEAVMVSRGHLGGMMAPDDAWPEENLSLLDNYLQLVRHEKEFSRRHAFTYTVESLDGNTVLGCVYIVPARRPKYQAEVFYWVRAGEDRTERERALGKRLEQWLDEEWPFSKERVAYPGRAIAWKAYLETGPPTVGE